tara:strand:+ start:7869 stop:8588 length:720 start_codon:yes stop_codon:yes gene_type:complete
MKIEKIQINKLKPATYNPRQISTKQYKDLKESIEKFSLVDPIIINKDLTVIGGHQRLKVCKELKHVEIDCVVLDLSKEEERELNIRLNKSGGEFDMDILANEFDIENLVDWGFKHVELGLNIDKIDENYTRKIKTPHYEPKNIKPELSKLVDERKQKELLNKIHKSNVDKETKEFLIKASQRHLVFNYSNIADFYSHSDSETKELMEQSALVIIDFDDAIQNGYVELSNDLRKLFDEEN